MKRALLILGSLLTVVVACKKDNSSEQSTSSSEYLIFGHFYGECHGDWCIEMYKLDTTNLYEDTKDSYPNGVDFYIGTYKLLSQQKFDSSMSLMNYFPIDLLTKTKTRIGNPDGADWGGLYIEYNFNGVRKFWLLDQIKSNVPSKYHVFIDEVNKRIKFNQ